MSVDIPPNPTSRGRRWRRRGIVGGALLALYAAAGFFALPWIAEGQIVKQSRALLDREATVERVRFNPFTLAASVEGFRLADRDGETLAAFDRLTWNFETTGIFRRAFRFSEVTVDRPIVQARILEDGRLSIADLLDREPAEGERDGPSSPPRLIVDFLAIREGRIDFADQSRSPAFSTRLTPLNVEVRDLVTLPDEEGNHALRIGLGEGTEIRWEGRQRVHPLHLTGRVETDGIDLTRIWAYLGTSFPLDLRRGKADAAVNYDLSRDADGTFEVQLTDASVSVRDVAVGPRAGEPDWLTIESVRMEKMDLAWPAATVDIERVLVGGPRGLARLEKDGRINWMRMLEGREQTPPAQPSPTPWRARVATVEVTGGMVRFEDVSVEPEVSVDVNDIAIVLGNVSSELASPIALEATAKVNDSASAAVTGSLAVQPLAADLDVRLGGLDVVRFQPYLSALPGARIASAVAGTEGKISLSGEPTSFRFEGTATIDQLEVRDPEDKRLLAWKGLRASGVRASGLPAKLRIKKVDVDAPYANIFIDRGGLVNLSRLGRQDSEPASSGPGADLEVVAVDVRDASVDYADESLILPFATKIHSGTARVRDLSTTGSAPASLEFEGRIDETGYAKAEGGLRLVDPYASTEIKVQFRDVAMDRLTPYSAEFAGYALEGGVLDVDIAYTIRDRRLVGNHQVVAKDLVLGDRIKGSSAATLPVRLAVALLKDKDGKIDLAVPIEGTVDSPEFAYRKVIWQAVKKILVNIAAAPFRAIGRLFGSDDEELELVEFDPGRSALLPVERDKLARLSAEVAKKPELTIAVEGRFDPELDTVAVRKAKLDALLESRRTSASDGEGATLDLLLEQLYAEQFSPEGLEAERGKEPESFDAAKFYESLRDRLLQAQPVTDDDLSALARDRARSIAEALTAGGALDASRVMVSNPVEAKRKKKGSQRIASEMIMAAESATGPKSGSSDD